MANFKYSNIGQLYDTLINDHSVSECFHSGKILGLKLK